MLVAIPILFEVRGLATECQSPHAGPPWWVRQHCSVAPSQVVAAIELCLLVIGVAALGGGIGGLLAARRHRPRRWPSVASGVVVAMSALYAVAFFFTLVSLGRWSF